MSAATLIQQAQAAGVVLRLEGGQIKATGDRQALAGMVEELRQHKAELAEYLATEMRLETVDAMLRADPSLRYAVRVADPDADPVVVAVGISGIATFDLEIPHAYYDGLTLLQLIEKHANEHVHT